MSDLKIAIAELVRIAAIAEGENSLTPEIIVERFSLTYQKFGKYGVDRVTICTKLLAAITQNGAASFDDAILLFDKIMAAAFPPQKGRTVPLNV